MPTKEASLTTFSGLWTRFIHENAAGKKREFIAWCVPADAHDLGSRPHWVAHVQEVKYEERGDAESGPMGLDENWEQFGMLDLDVRGENPSQATLWGGLVRALEDAIHVEEHAT